MPDSSRASVSVIAAAVVAILASLFLLLTTSFALFGISLNRLSNASPELPPFVRTAIVFTMTSLMGLSIFGIATGIGLILVRNWARISILIWGGTSVFFGAIGIPIGYFVSTTPLTDTPDVPQGSMQVVRWILLFIYGLPLAMGIWWLILFNRKSVKAQFAGTATLGDPSLAQKPRCPTPIAAIAWLYISSILNLLFLPFLPFRLPVFIFGLVLPKSLGIAVLILSGLAFAAAGVGLLKLKTWSYSLTIGLQVFWLISSIVSMLSPTYNAVIDSMLKEMRVSLHLPETRFSQGHSADHHGWALFLVLAFAGAVLGLLAYYRPRFLEAASAAASAS